MVLHLSVQIRQLQKADKRCIYIMSDTCRIMTDNVVQGELRGHDTKSRLSVLWMKERPLLALAS